ncbi:hypothetical protein ACFWM3_19255 [Gottfriedia sp. NPDC058432]|uniref:hypothetical protein n=1 Tax=Gottfriedia sp. NPDC058432 TaxID=3346497 RepID=UPI00364A8F28
MQSTIQNILSNFKKFENMNTMEIGREIGLNINLISNKLSVATLSNQMFKYFDIDLSNLKNDFNIAVKTVRLKENKIPKESMSFEQINFHRVVKEDWDNSFLKKKFMDTTFIFIVFEYLGEALYFKGLRIWKMPEVTINNELHSFWTSLKSKLETGVTIKFVQKGNKSINENDLPSSRQSKIMHVRPKAKNASDMIELPDGQLITKQSYWFNNEYVSSILSTMPNLQVKSNSTKESELEDYDYQKIKPLLNEICTISEFVRIAKDIFSNFDDFDLENDKLNSIGYKLSPPFILRNDIKSSDDYFRQKILCDRYFTLKNDEVWQSNFVKRKLENMENDYTIFKIEEGLYLTETALKYAPIDKSEIISYRESVEGFIENDQYFTYNSLEKSNFQHNADSYGFDEIFYESLLKRPGRIKSIKIGGKLFFNKTTSKVDLANFIQFLFTKHNKILMSLYELIDMLEVTFYVKLNIDIIHTLLCSNEINQFYSPELKIIFCSKKDYLDFIE